MHYHCRLVLCFAISLLLSVTATPVKYPKPEEISHNPVVDNDIGGDHGAEIDLKYSTYGTKVEEKTSTTPASHQKSNQYYEYSWGTPIQDSENGAIAQVTFKQTPNLYYYGVAEAGPRHLKVVYFNRQHKPRKQRKQNNKRYRY